MIGIRHNNAAARDLMMPIEIQLIGPLKVTAGGQELLLPRSRKARALLVMLALEPWDHPRTALCAHIWPDTADPRADLRWSLSRLRAVLGAEAIVSSPAGLRMNTDHIVTDVGRLEALLERAGEPGAVEALGAHALRFSSTLLPDLDGDIGVEYELWLESQRLALGRLQQRLLGALIQQLDDRPEDALDLARRRLALDPLNESAAIDVLRLTLRVSGRPQAQATLEQTRARLKDAGLPDTGVLAAWRRLTHRDGAVPAREPAAGFASQPAAGSPSDLVAPALEVRSPPQKPSVAVLGFQSLDDGDEQLLATGLAVDVTTRLAMLRGLFVIARGSAARFSLAELSAPEIGRRLGVRYLVHGSTRRLGSRLRVTADLVECERGEQLWSEHFERPLGDLFAVQDEIVDAIVAALEPQIELAERERARLLPTEDLNAWECFHRAMWHLYRFTAADNQQAQRLLRRALKLDSGFARAYAGLSFSHFLRAFLGDSSDVETDVRQALEHARQSVGLEPRDCAGHWCLGRALFLDRCHDQALAAIDRSLVLNPNYAQGHYARGFIGCHAGLSNEVVADLDMAQRLSPFDPLLFAMETCRAISLAVTGRREDAAALALRATQAPNAHFHIHAIAAACLQLAGRTDEAAGKVREVKLMYPDYRVAVFERSFPNKIERDRRMMSDALRAAGMDA